MLRASASPAEDRKLTQPPLYTTVAGIATSDEGNFPTSIFVVLVAFQTTSTFSYLIPAIA